MALQWTAIFAGGLAVGASVVGLLVLRRNREFLAFLLGIAGVVLGTWGVIEIVDVYADVRPAIGAIVLSLASLGGGYALASSLLPYLRTKPIASSLPEYVVPTTDLWGVVLLACIEPETYSPAAITAELEHLTEAGLPEATLGITPFLYTSQKARYRAMGNRNPATSQAKLLCERLESALGDSVHSILIVSCVGQDTLANAIERYASQGVSKVIVTTIAIGEEYIVDRAKAATDTLRPEAHGMRILYTPPLWGSEALTEHVTDLVWRNTEQPETTGVALIVHGQPDAWQRSHSVFDVQENSFVNRVRMSLTERGIPQSNIRICFMEWQNPGVTETVRHLAALGCHRVLVCPACCPFDNATTRLDLQVSIKQARADDHVTTVILDSWGNGNVTSEILAETILRAIREG